MLCFVQLMYSVSYSTHKPAARPKTNTSSSLVYLCCPTSFLFSVMCFILDTWSLWRPTFDCWFCLEKLLVWAGRACSHQSETSGGLVSSRHSDTCSSVTHLHLHVTSRPLASAEICSHAVQKFAWLAWRSPNTTKPQSHAKRESSKDRFFYNVTQSTTRTHKTINDK